MLKAPKRHTPTPTRVPAKHGFYWLSDGLRLFKMAPLPWIGIMLIWLVITSLSIAIPFANLIQPFFTAGIAALCFRLDTTGQFIVKELLAGFTRQAGPLFVISIISTGGPFLVIVIASTVGLGSYLSMAELSKEALASGAGTDEMLTILSLLLAVATLLTPLIMAVWYAPLLITLNNASIIESMKLSFNACIKNVMPIFVSSLAVSLLLLFAALPLFLGYFILIPVLMASVYTSYKDIFILE